MRLFKYLTPARIDVLQHHKIRFTQPQALNDPFELKPNIIALAKDEELLDGFDDQFPKIIAEEYEPFRNIISFADFLATNISNRPKAQANFPHLINKSLPEIKAMFHRVFNRSIGVLCLTASPDNLLMWAHYADEHRGFLIEFESDSPFFDQRSGHSDYRFLQRVQYHAQRPRFVLKDVDGSEMFLTKSIDWEYEQEWRMFLPLQQAQQKLTIDEQDICLFNFPKSAVKSITFGCRTSNEIKIALLDILINDPDYHGTLVQQAQLDDSHYKINITSLNAPSTPPASAPNPAPPQSS